MVEVVEEDVDGLFHSLPRSGAMIARSLCHIQSEKQKRAGTPKTAQSVLLHSFFGPREVPLVLLVEVELDRKTA